MAPTPKNQRTPTSFSKLNHTQIPNSRTPLAKHKLNFTNAKPSINPNSLSEHPIEVIGRIRDYPERKEKPVSALQVINPDRGSLRVKTDVGYRDFSLDGVSLSLEEDLDEFYKKFVKSRINGVKMGDKCTVMMYGPTGAGKSYNMFGSCKQPGIVYRSLRDILGDGTEENDENGVGTFVQVTVLEIYNEELYDLLSTNSGGGFGFGWSKGSASKGAGKSYNMFGSSKQPGIVYRSVRDILGDGNEENGVGTFVQVTVLEIYIEELYDLLSTNNCGGFGFGWSKGNASKGAGKSYNMFGSSKQPGIVYRSVRDILGDGNEENGVGTFVQVTVLEIYIEELYDLLSTNNCGGFGFGWSKGNASKVRLEVIGKKAKNATFISGTEATKISKEIQKVEKRRIVKSTLCNERSSRSHCMIILDVPTVGGRLMLVDMAGSENIEQAGQTGLEAKMQTGKINQGNIALKRVVESIANGDSHVPFRDSKLTMLLQDSFEDDKSKILMILCVSPDPKELHKTISTLEYGAKAKCIVRGPHTPLKEKGAEDCSSAVILGSRIAVMDQFICKLQMENKLKEKECNDSKKKLIKKEEEIATLRSKLHLVVLGGAETKVNERTLKHEFEKKIQQCREMANEFVEMERRKMEERMFQQQQEFEMLRRRLEEIEAELWRSRVAGRSPEVEENSFAKRLLDSYSEDAGMVKSMDLDRSIDMDAKVYKAESSTIQEIFGNPREVEDPSILLQHFTNKSFLDTVFEEEEEGHDSDGDIENPPVEEVQKDVIEEKTICTLEDRSDDLSSEAAPSRKELIQNIFKLCGNSRELSKQCITTVRPAEKKVKDTESKSPPVKEIGEDSPVRRFHNFSSEEIVNDSKQNVNPTFESIGTILEVHVKWEAASKENPGIITTLRVVKGSSLADLRKLIEIYLGADNQELNFLDKSGAPVLKEQEAITPVSKLSWFNDQLHGYLACLRSMKGTEQPNYLPFTPLENKLLSHCIEGH